MSVLKKALRRLLSIAEISPEEVATAEEADYCASDDRFDFEKVAMEHSTCPSGQQGGALGEFSPGQMVKEFDEVVFSGDVGKVLGPVKTQFGYHLIEITSRTE
ncbi:MAG: peptidylprolyl isomerase [Desulfuromusa sp.]|jgi:parvulin-like peptidyl-prolyl isomerase|nr:peptidylprolyl isomerase [Desulfuromusa sp.]